MRDVLLIAVGLLACAGLSAFAHMVARRIRIFTTGSSLLEGKPGQKVKLEELADGDWDTECVACGSEEITRNGEAMYRCRECGYEGGSGYARAQQERVLAAWSSRPVAERKKAAMADLLAAKRVLGGPGSAARGGIGPAGMLGYTRFGSVVAGAQIEAMNEARRDMTDLVREGARHLHEAQLKLVGLDVMDSEFDYQEAAIRVHHSKLDLMKVRLEREVDEAMGKVMALPD